MASYITLMGSLPYLGNLFGKKQTPISRLRLEERLKMLSEQDAILLNQIASLIAWQQQPMERSDAEFVSQAKQFLQEASKPTLRKIVESRLNLRTIIAALRRRHRGESNPPVGQPWGIGPWVNYIERYWSEPGFRLEGMFPWVLEANRLLHANDSVGLERLQFEVNWKMLEQLEARHYFDFEAIVIYLMRWSMVDRWSRYEGEAAVKRFRTLVDSGIEKFTDVFA